MNKNEIYPCVFGKVNRMYQSFWVIIFNKGEEKEKKGRRQKEQEKPGKR